MNVFGMTLWAFCRWVCRNRSTRAKVVNENVIWAIFRTPLSKKTSIGCISLEKHHFFKRTSPKIAQSFALGVYSLYSTPSKSEMPTMFRFSLVVPLKNLPWQWWNQGVWIRTSYSVIPGVVTRLDARKYLAQGSRKIFSISPPSKNCSFLSDKAFWANLVSKLSLELDLSIDDTQYGWYIINI